MPEKNREKNGNGLDITSRVHGKNEVVGPADESMMPGYRMYGSLLEKHIGKPSAVDGQGEQPVTASPVRSSKTVWDTLQQSMPGERNRLHIRMRAWDH